MPVLKISPKAHDLVISVSFSAGDVAGFAVLSAAHAATRRV